MILSLGAVAAYGLFTFTKNPVLIPVLILCIGLFFAGIYPSSVSALNAVVDYSGFGMGIAMGSAGLGSIIMPSVTGAVAKNHAISYGMICIWVTIILMLACSIIIFIRKNKERK